MKIIEHDSVIRTDSNEYGIIIGYFRYRQKRETIDVKFITNDNRLTYRKTYVIEDGEMPKEIVIEGKNKEKYELLMASDFGK